MARKRRKLTEAERAERDARHAENRAHDLRARRAEEVAVAKLRERSYPVPNLPPYPQDEEPARGTPEWRRYRRQEDARIAANARWLRDMAQRGYDRLRERGYPVPDLPPYPEGEEPRRGTPEWRAYRRAEDVRAQAEIRWLREMADKGKAELEERKRSAE